MPADLETDIKAAGEAGYDYVEIRTVKLYEYLKNKSIEDLKKLLAENNLQVYSINAIEHATFRTNDDYEEIKAETEKVSKYAKELGCKYIVVVPGKLPENATKPEIINESVRVLNELADIAEKYDVSIGFEFLGQHDCSVQTLDLCNEIVETINRPNVGNVIDTFHFFAGDSNLEDIEKLDAEKLFIFHINDAEDLPKSQLTDAHRLYPGEGILPLKEIKEKLDKIGYNKMVSIEIFRPEYWEQDPVEVAKKAKAATETVLGINWE